MFDRETVEAVKTINAGLGTRHRTKPYVMNNAHDLRHALELAVGAYRDYWYYTQQLCGIGDDFDESLENYDIATWLELKPEQTDELSTNCADAVETACRLFGELNDRASDHLSLILKAALSLPPDSQRTVFGQAYSIEPDEMDAQIADLIDALDESEYFRPIPENFKLLLRRADELWHERVQ